MFRFPHNLYAAPDTTVDTPVDNGKLSIEDMVGLMGEDDNKELDKADKDKEDLLTKVDEEEKTEEKTEEIEEEKIDELKLEDEDLDQIEDVPRKAILAKYPTLFKEFPQLEKAYYREQRYAELLPTIDDAKEAVEKANNYDKFEQSVLQGNLDTILGSVKGADEKAFARMVDNYLPILSKVDQTAYYHVLGNVIKNTIVSMVREGQNTSNEQLKAAAVVLNQFIFGSSDFKPPTTFGDGKVDDPEVTKLQSERAQFIQEKFETVLEELGTKSNNTIKSTISNHIDPKGVMTDYVKRTAVKEAVNNVEELIRHDARFKAQLDKLWERAFDQNFNHNSLDAIHRAYLNKARVLLPAVIQRHRAEALKGLGKRTTDEREEATRKGLPAKGGPASTNNKSNKAGDIPKGMKTLDFLMQD